MNAADHREVWHPAYVGLGSNLDDPPARLRSAMERLAALDRTRLVARSRLYRSAPMGPADQPDYVNAAAALMTQLTPEALLEHLQQIEQAHGRRRDGERWGPRTLDLDLLVYGHEQRDTPRLVLPHPGIAERAFVLMPLHDLAPWLAVPGRGPVSRLLRTVDAAGLVVLGDA